FRLGASGLKPEVWSLKPASVRKKGRTRVVNEHGMRRCQRLPVRIPLTSATPAADSIQNVCREKPSPTASFRPEMSKYVDAGCPLQVNVARSRAAPATKS